MTNLKFKIQSKNFISNDVGLVDDIINLIDKYANVEYQKVYNFIYDLVTKLNEYGQRIKCEIIENPTIPDFIDKMSEVYINKFGLTYTSFNEILDLSKTKIDNFEIFMDKDFEDYDPFAHFIKNLADNILIDKIYDPMDLIFFYPVFKNHFMMWGISEGFWNGSQYVHLRFRP